jgi:hypothetical protein
MEKRDAASSEALETGVFLGFMPNPLPDSVVNQLQDPTSALAAVFVIASLHPDLLQWAASMVEPPRPEPRRRRRKAKKANGNGSTRKSAPEPSGGRAAYFERLRAKRDAVDEALVAEMKSSPDSSIADWAAATGRSRSSTVAALHRLRDRDLAESVEGRWRLSEEPAPRETSKWTAPLSGRAQARSVVHAGA